MITTTMPDDKPPDYTDTDRDTPLSRREVMKAAGAATITGAAMTETAAANDDCSYADKPYYVEDADCDTVTVCADEATEDCPVWVWLDSEPSDEHLTSGCPREMPAELPTESGDTCATIPVPESLGFDYVPCCEPYQAVFQSTPPFETPQEIVRTRDIDVDCYHSDEITEVEASCEEVKICVDDGDCPVTATLYFDDDCGTAYRDVVVGGGEGDDCITLDSDDLPDCCTPQYVELLEEEDRYPDEGTFDVGPCGHENDSISTWEASCDRVSADISGSKGCPIAVVLDLGDCDPSTLSKTVTVGESGHTEVTFTDQEIPGCCTPQTLRLEDADGNVTDSVSLSQYNCGYEDLSVRTGTVNCDEIEVVANGVECDVTAVLHTTGTGCPTENPSYTFTNADTVPSGDLHHTFTLGGCCTPDYVEFKDQDGNVLEGTRLPASGSLETGELCGYDDLTFENVEFSCDEMSFSVSGVECTVKAIANFSEGALAETTVTSDDQVSFTWGTCLSPESITLETTDGKQFATIEPDDPLNCVCDSANYETCKFDVEDDPLPSLYETKTFECGGEQVTVKTTDTNDGVPSCFKVVDATEPLFGVVVKGGPKENPFDLSNGGCGTEPPTQEFCSKEVGRSGKPAAVSYWTVTVCTEDLTTGTVPGSVTSQDM